MSYAGHEIKVLGTCDVEVVYQDVQKPLTILVVEGQGPSLLGRDWLLELKLNWREIQQIQATEVKWNWKEEQEKAFQEAKELLKSPRLLTHYDSTKNLILTCDASLHGVGAILSQ